MNIQGLIERYEKFKASKKKMTSVDLVLKDLRSLDEPEPLPFKLKDVVRRIRGFDPTTQTRWLNGILKELGDDYGSMKYREGYEVEEEKRYVVKVKGNIKENMLVYGEFLERYFFAKNSNLYNVIYFHTRKELEEANFGWVFDCEGIEIEEVEE
nr:MAG TPA: Protein of unknown function (DUF1642) [Caudoviricetes sp.]